MKTTLESKIIFFNQSKPDNTDKSKNQDMKEHTCSGRCSECNHCLPDETKNKP